MRAEQKRAYVEALYDEHQQYARSTNPSRVIAVEEELAKFGHAVDGNGRLIEVDEKDKEKSTPEKRPARERAVSKAPEQAVDKG